MRKFAILLPVSLCVAGFLTGCGVDSPTTSTSGTAHISGTVHGGQQPVSGSQVYMFRAGTGGNGTAAVSMLNGPGFVTSNTTGAFSITTDYTCSSSSDQVYMVAVGGNPGLAAGSNNPAMVMVDVLGSCGNLTAATNIYIDEITTAAAAWTLAPFATSYANIASSATNKAGITNAFLDTALLADAATGLAPTTLPANLTAQTGKLYAMADALASCVNSTGTTGCAPLFTAATPSGGTAPTDTFSAALNIVKNPGYNVAEVFNVIPPTAVYPTTLTTAPYDWTMALTISGGGMNGPTSLDIDAENNVWVADYYGALSEFSPQGTPLSGVAGFGVGALNEAYGLTIDTSGYIWVANEESSPNAHGSLSKFDGSNTSSPGRIVNGNGGTNFYDASIDYPVGMAADNNGNFFIANYANSSATVYNSGGAVVATGLGSGFGFTSSGNPVGAAFPVAVTPDLNHGAWLANLGDDTITHVDQNNDLLATPNCCIGANGLALDSAGNVWVADYYGNAFSEVSNGGAVLINDAPLVDPTLNESYPAGVSVDAGQNIWMANYRGESIAELSGIYSRLPGTLLSTGYGFGYTGGTAPLMLLPYAVVPDRSGNLWVSNFGNNNLIVLFGMATPTSTPTQPVAVAP